VNAPTVIRERAREAREHAAGRLGAEASLDELIEAALEHYELDVIPCAPGSKALGPNRAKLDRKRGVILVDETLTDEERRFTLAHELGHFILEGHEDECDGARPDPAPVLDPFPLGEAYVTGYSPRQRNEVEASLFAAEFVAPTDRLRANFVAGLPASALARTYGVSATVIHGQLIAALLQPEIAPRTPSGPGAFKLHPKQEEARSADRKPTLVDAGPGTGKTRTLTERVLYLLGQGVPPEAILCLTFSNKAAAEMQERIEHAAGARGRRQRVQTFHAFGLDLLRAYPKQAGIQNDVALLDRTEAADLLDRHLLELDLKEYRHVGEPGFYLDSILDAISRAKDEMVGPDGYAELAATALAKAAEGDEKAQKAARRHAEVARVYAAYQRLLDDAGAVDFGDLIYRVVLLLEGDAEVAAEVAANHPYVLVDEYQDVNRASAELLKRLRAGGEGLWVVGDVRQAIYGFRGASRANLRGFHTDFPAAGEPIPLVRNYRSAPHLLRVFSHVAKSMRDSEGFADWEAEREDGVGEAIFAVAADEESELAGIASQILASCEEGRPFADHAVLCHRNRDVQTVALALEKRGIPVANFGNFFERREVRDLLSLLALTVEYGATALPRFAQMVPHSVGEADFQVLLAAALDVDGGLPALARGEAPAGMDPAVFQRFADDWSILSGAAFRDQVWTFFAAYLFEDGRYLRHLLAEGSAASRQRLLAVGQLVLIARAFDAHHEGTAAEPEVGIHRKRAFLRFVRRLWRSGDNRIPVPPSSDDAVRVGTVHGSKGLEFPVVFVPFLVEGRFPFQAPWDHAPPPPGLFPEDPDAAEAELESLFFVALTRARDRLVLSHASSYGGKKPPQPSKLLRLIDSARRQGLFTEVEWARQAGEPAGEARAPLAQPLAELRYAALDAYIDCPRRYFYRHVLNLPEPEDGRIYLAYSRAARLTLGWLEERHREGARPSEWAEVEAAFDLHWTETVPADHVHTRFYRAEALAYVRDKWERGELTPPAAAWQDEVTVEVEGVRITIPVEATRVEEGTLRVGHRYFRSRKPDEDHLELRYPLLRQGLAASAPDRQAVVEAHYAGEVVQIQPLRPHDERNKLDKVKAAVRGITSGEFPAAPPKGRDRECCRCPFCLTCPA
jgi:superfamily I DNA/RNA helicase